jgi:hypothetical protein
MCLGMSVVCPSMLEQILAGMSEVCLGICSWYVRASPGMPGCIRTLKALSAQKTYFGGYVGGMFRYVGGMFGYVGGMSWYA